MRLFFSLLITVMCYALQAQSPAEPPKEELNPLVLQLKVWEETAAHYQTFITTQAAIRKRFDPLLAPEDTAKVAILKTAYARKMAEQRRRNKDFIQLIDNLQKDTSAEVSKEVATARLMDSAHIALAVKSFAFLTDRFEHQIRSITEVIMPMILPNPELEEIANYLAAKYDALIKPFKKEIGAAYTVLRNEEHKVYQQYTNTSTKDSSPTDSTKVTPPDTTLTRLDVFGNVKFLITKSAL